MERTPQGPSHWRGDPAEIVAATDTTARVDATLRRLAALRPSWTRDALCSEFDLAPWFPTRGQSNQPALDICGRCPVRVQCLDEALADRTLDVGIRGGMTANARKARRRALRGAR